jgi:hypothetical protein
MSLFSRKPKSASPQRDSIIWNTRGKDIDEIVIDYPNMVHIEQLDKRCWWIGIFLDDQGNGFSGHFTANSRGVMTFSPQTCDIEWAVESSHED